MDDDRRAVSESGADDFVTKPCVEGELLDKIATLLNVTYDYEDASVSEAEPIAGLKALGANWRGKLPRELVEELRNATLSGNKKLLNTLILKVDGAEDAKFAQALQALADKYEYDALTRLLEEVCST
jgi:CheY-like chemotaxis protein